MMKLSSNLSPGQAQCLGTTMEVAWRERGVSPSILTGRRAASSPVNHYTFDVSHGRLRQCSGPISRILCSDALWSETTRLMVQRP